MKKRLWVCCWFSSFIWVNEVSATGNDIDERIPFHVLREFPDDGDCDCEQGENISFSSSSSTWKNAAVILAKTLGAGVLATGVLGALVRWFSLRGPSDSETGNPSFSPLSLVQTTSSNYFNVTTFVNPADSVIQKSLEGELSLITPLEETSSTWWPTTTDLSETADEDDDFNLRILFEEQKPCAHDADIICYPTVSREHGITVEGELEVEFFGTHCVREKQFCPFLLERIFTDQECILLRCFKPRKGKFSLVLTDEGFETVWPLAVRKGRTFFPSVQWKGGDFDPKERSDICKVWHKEQNIVRLSDQITLFESCFSKNHDKNDSENYGKIEESLRIQGDLIDPRFKIYLFPHERSADLLQNRIFFINARLAPRSQVLVKDNPPDKHCNPWGL